MLTGSVSLFDSIISMFCCCHYWENQLLQHSFSELVVFCVCFGCCILCLFWLNKCSVPFCPKRSTSESRSLVRLPSNRAGFRAFPLEFLGRIETILSADWHSIAQQIILMSIILYVSPEKYNIMGGAHEIGGIG